MKELVAFLLLVALFLLSGTCSAGDRTLEEVLVVSTGVADSVLTEVMLERGVAEELNPLGQNRAARIAMKAGTTAFVLWFARRIEDESPGWARTLRWTSIAAWGGASAWNVSVTVRLP